MRILKKIGIILGILAVIIGAVFIIFHDDTDMEQKAKEQIESINESTPKHFEALNDKEFEDTTSLSN
jgi:hypothetical protein